MKKIIVNVEDNKVGTLCRFLDIIDGVDEYSNPIEVESDNIELKSTINNILIRYDLMMSNPNCSVPDGLKDAMEELREIVQEFSNE